ncbi:hypothetical protein [Afipia clevelandensis]|uniref:Uncharacterized protein n=1 Tax=Afipia clevelandensis ATCC 49720 TaxID=883079 RepID=K8NYJ1_9BRAD|nr:hypothetical protein [Afipia clevelandensis]EGP09739.1 hypothetical protein CSIRO_0546 [Bradyrhizobiaceae bacterium SG-6C]EKS33569.1 hypothetical protein HMPREF9696_02689 [Afipia clevelandensis ATCC 49720]
MFLRLFANAPAMLAAGCLSVLISSDALAQQKAKPLKTGEVLSGELTAMRSGPRKKRVITYQLTSEPRRLPPPSGMCNLETGPETFQIVTNSDAEAAALKPYIGKSIALKANELSCAQAAGQLSDAIVTKWSVVTRH